VCSPRTVRSNGGPGVLYTHVKSRVESPGHVSYHPVEQCRVGTVECVSDSNRGRWGEDVAPDLER
jgi:hypothetical protein